MTPDPIDDLLRRARPEPPEALRARVLAAAAAMATRPAPWWTSVRTWATAAVLLIAADLAQLASAPHTPPPDPVMATVDRQLRPYPSLTWIAPTLSAPPVTDRLGACP